MASVLVIIAFGIKNKKQTLKTILFFYLINFIYAGIMLGIYFLINPIGMTHQNSIFYFDISALMLCICTIVSYLVIQLVIYLLNKNIKKDEMLPIEVQINNNRILLNAFIDTGNQLVDLMTSLPVIMCEISTFKSIFTDEIYENIYNKNIDLVESNYWRKKLKLIYVDTAVGSNMLVAFKADKISYIKDNQSHEKQAVIALSPIKISSGEFNAIMGTNLL